ncbi:LCP family protein [Lihuaxuella thermophila]|uniref:Cell envelope-related function transcriptional attenuator common domain-containing protein n=1 Tax=Lihuaxuella thermophila TaxID=1173111 RepID=A0A1H8B9K3_9BACL|nr:LCP family protein [Lihuaxuella thermophila]SEM78708.1 cell envelope-related function transcriptional attenuator common domain-containing protein [Lihuaxuella thermophila]
MHRVAHSRVDRVKKKRRRRWVFRVITLVLLLTVGIGSYFGYQVVSALNKSHDSEVGGSKLRAQPVKPKEEPFAVMLLGADTIDVEEEKSLGWRPDVIMIAAVNPKTKSAKLVSIPRDTYVKIANTGGHRSKINDAAMAGVKRGINPVDNVRQTVENLLGIPIDYYAKVNFQGFVDIVDAVGGVDVYNTRSFRGPAIGKKIFIGYGDQHLDGMKALAYVRQRKDDPEGDMGRNKRQQEVISKIIGKIASVEGVTKFSDVVEAVGKNFTFNIPLSEVPSMLALYKEIPKENIERIEFKTYTQEYGIVNGIRKKVYWERYREKDLEQIRQLLRQQLNWTGNDSGSGAAESTENNNQ